MIKSFKHKGLEKLFIDGSKAGVHSTMVPKLENILAILDAASHPGDITAPSLRMHPLTGNLAGFWAVTVRANWRITFRFAGEDVADVNLDDYH